MTVESLSRVNDMTELSDDLRRQETSMSLKKHAELSFITADDWRALFKNNSSCLKGFVASNDTSQLEIAQYTAFRFHLESGHGPEFVDENKTEVLTLEVDSDFHQSSINHGISKTEIDLILADDAISKIYRGLKSISQTAANSGSTMKQDISGPQLKEIKLGLAVNNSGRAEDTSTRTRKKLQISHKHSKKRVFLDERYLRLSDQCEHHLRILKTSKDPKEFLSFLANYGMCAFLIRDQFLPTRELGEFFPTQIVLGGHIYHNEDVNTIEGKTLAEKESNLRIHAAASLISHSASLHKGHEKSSKDEFVSNTRKKGTFWSRIGGEGDVHRDFHDWEESLKRNETWRIIERTRLRSLPQVISQFDGWGWVNGVFNQHLIPPPKLSQPTQILYDHFSVKSSISLLANREPNTYPSGVGRKSLDFIFFQDQNDSIRYGFIGEDQKDDILVEESIVEAREKTPIIAINTDYIIYVDKRGIICDQLLCGPSYTWDSGDLSDLNLRVSPYSNLQYCHGFLCFAKPDNTIGLLENIGYYKWKIIPLNHTPGNEILPGSPFLVYHRKSSIFAGLGTKGGHSNITISYQCIDGEMKFLSLLRGSSTSTKEVSQPWNLSQFTTADVPRSLLCAAGIRNRYYLSSNGSIIYLLAPNTHNKLIRYKIDIVDGTVTRYPKEMCTIRDGSQFSYASSLSYNHKLIFIDEDGQPTMITLDRYGDCVLRKIFGPKCRRRKDWKSMEITL